MTDSGSREAAPGEVRITAEEIEITGWTFNGMAMDEARDHALEWARTRLAAIASELAATSEGAIDQETDRGL